MTPEHRRRGHATEILRQSVRRLASLGVERVLVTYDDDTAGSAAVIEANGGVLEDIRAVEGRMIRRYWVDAVQSPSRTQASSESDHRQD